MNFYHTKNVSPLRPAHRRFVVIIAEEYRSQPAHDPAQVSDCLRWSERSIQIQFHGDPLKMQPAIMALVQTATSSVEFTRELFERYEKVKQSDFGYQFDFSEFKTCASWWTQAAQIPLHWIVHQRPSSEKGI